MEKTYITNNHLKRAVQEFQKYLDNDEDAPQEALIELMGELQFSNLLIPGRIEDDSLNFEHLISEEDDSCAIPLFTDDDEFAAHYGGDYELDPIACDFDYYVELVENLSFDGILINPESEDFFIESELILNYPFSRLDDDDSEEGYEPSKLLQIAKEAKNDSLLQFIESGSDQFEALMNELHESILLNVVSSEESLDKFAKDGIISCDDVGGFEVCSTAVDGDEYGILFTSLDAINETKGDDAHYYGQLALLDDFFEYVLTGDMDGIIINPGKEDYVISRAYIMEAYGGLTYNNQNFKRAMEYAFIL